MSIGPKEFSHQTTRSGDYVCSCYVFAPSGSSVVSGGLAGACDHRRDNSSLHNRISCLPTLPRRRKMVGTLTKKEWAYA